MIKLVKGNWIPLLIGVIIVWVVISEIVKSHHTRQQDALSDQQNTATDSTWVAPSLFLDPEPKGKEREMVIYGQNLIAHTAAYFGPHGSVAHSSNGMNCQNCHLDAGTRAWGNNYGAVFATYPQYRSRSNAVQDIYGRVNDCFERSLNGKALDTGSHEMQAIYAYMKWLGQSVDKGRHPYGSGLPKLTLPDRAADPQKGKEVYVSACQSCHGSEGQGAENGTHTEYNYPPLWGEHSYNDGAGLYRLGSFASFVYNNMPFGQASHLHPRLSQGEAWDVAAFVNSQPRPHLNQHGDWPDVSKKPFDAPFAPYADSFPQRQHKYGPFGPIVDATKKNK
ncbi:MAG: c-type cytochrome [Williamsia sp.]|nr:c-type cytochrome [Williamsia sp.]